MTQMGEIHLRGDSGRDTLLGNQPSQCLCQPRSSARPPQHLPVGFIFYGISGGPLALRFKMILLRDCNHVVTISFIT